MLNIQFHCSLCIATATKKPITDARVILGCIVQISYLILLLMPITRSAVIFLFKERNLQVDLAIFDAATLYASMLVSLDTSFQQCNGLLLLLVVSWPLLGLLSNISLMY